MENTLAVAVHDDVADAPPPNMAAVVSTAIRLNDEQQIALEAILDFIGDPEQFMFVLSGFAGTGKTFLMQEVVTRCKGSYAKFAFTAPTNKAAKVLRGITGHACTIYSLLGLRIEKNGELKKLVGGEPPEDLADLDVIFLDEASMVNQHLFKLLEDIVKYYKVKIIFLGDSAQLPPVGEAVSPVWKLESKAVLTKIMRYDNQILKFVTAVRDVIPSFAPSVQIKSDNANGEGVWKLLKTQFKEAIYNEAMKGTFADGSKGKVIAWRNVRVAEYNDLIRRAIFGGTAVPGNYVVGERIIATAPCKRGEDVLLSTDDEAIVESVIATTHPFHPEYHAYELKCCNELGKTIRLVVLHPNSAEQFDKDCQELAHRAKVNPKLWKQFWELKDIFHEIKYAYAITAHRAQGSTYESVFVDSQDILLNRNRKEAFQCFYVASSRAQKRLLLA
jgi:ATP-dependent exoDNAse (exonuclease V) alpha subunit